MRRPSNPISKIKGWFRVPLLSQTGSITILSQYNMLGYLIPPVFTIGLWWVRALTKRAWKKGGNFLLPFSKGAPSIEILVEKLQYLTKDQNWTHKKVNLKQRFSSKVPVIQWTSKIQICKLLYHLHLWSIKSKTLV